MLRAVCLLLALAAAACTTKADVRYTPTGAPLMRGTPAVATVAVVNEREDKDPTYVGSIRGGYGNPMDTLITPRPISDEVADAFSEALRQRNLLGPSGPYGLAVQLTQFSVNQYIGRTATVAFRLRLLTAGGTPVYQDAVSVHNVNGGVFAGASMADLQAIMAKTLTQAIDEAIDKPGFRAALVRPGS